MDLTNIIVKNNLPYPKIEDAEKSMQTVAILKNLMSGANGELQGVLQYFY